MQSVYKIKNSLVNGEYDNLFHNTLCCDASIAVKRTLDVLDGFVKSFADEECALFSSPGRTELGGNHTDHQGGAVLAAAVNMDMLCAASKTDNNFVCIEAEQFGRISVDLSTNKPIAAERGTSAALVRGVASWFEERGYKISGINAYVVSDVPPGSGMSSSASFEVLIGTIFNSFFADNTFSKVDIAKAGLYAENIYFGKPCGLMDQIACAVGGVVSIDFSDSIEPKVQSMNANFNKNGYSLCLISTGGDHTDLTSEYANITNEMKEISCFFGKEKLSEINEKDVVGNFAKLRELCGDRAVLRAINYFEEDRRAKKMADVLLANDINAYLKLVNMSGNGSFMYLQNIYPSGSKKMQPVAVALKAAELSLAGEGAVRVHGGGFAGTIQAYVPNVMLNEFISNMEEFLYPGCCSVLKVRKVGAVKIEVEN